MICIKTAAPTDHVPVRDPDLYNSAARPDIAVPEKACDKATHRWLMPGVLLRLELTRPMALPEGRAQSC
ncbi:hypothetical protein SSBR45G_17150 [Bradyrhizobium sp. SSBR45G]|nr:hypothetical protein SSBR45G_17150 [Bradyrhizobium sp. SSBR45G]GLH83565.1 hypothetical protein SSBR45R_10250 [Bradyrhizobium sp. SSBR45R]